MHSDLNIKLNIMPENTIPIVSLYKEKSLAKVLQQRSHSQLSLIEILILNIQIFS